MRNWVAGDSSGSSADTSSLPLSSPSPVSWSLQTGRFHVVPAHNGKTHCLLCVLLPSSVLVKGLSHMVPPGLPKG